MGLPNVIGDLRSDGSIKMTADFDLNSHKALNLTDGSSAQDAAAFHQAGGGGGGTSGNGTGWVVPVDTSFSWLHQGSSTETLVTKNGQTYIQLVGPAETFSHVRSFVKAIPSTPYAIEAGFRPPPNAFSGAVDYVVGLVLIDSVSDKQVVMGPYPGGNQIWSSQYSNFTTTTGSTATVSYTPRAQDFVWLRMEDDGTNLTGKYSWDGITYIQLFTFTRAGNFTPSHMGLMVLNNDGSHTVTMNIVHFNYGTGI